MELIQSVDSGKLIVEMPLCQSKATKNIKFAEYVSPDYFGSTCGRITFQVDSLSVSHGLAF